MAEPENQTIRLLREMRVALKRLEGKVDQNHTDLTSRMDNLRQAINGESVLGRYAAAEVEERPDAVEVRLKRLERN